MLTLVHAHVIKYGPTVMLHTGSSSAALSMRARVSAMRARVRAGTRTCVWLDYRLRGVLFLVCRACVWIHHAVC